MKTIKSASNEVKRVTDEEAAKLVKGGTYKYAKKSEWKKIRGPVTQPVSKKNIDQPWKEKRGRKNEKAENEVKVEETAGAIKEEKRELTAQDIMAAGDKVMQQAMDITAQEDKKGKKTNKKSKK